MARKDASPIQWIFFSLLLLGASALVAVKWPSLFSHRPLYFLFVVMDGLAVAALTFGAMRSFAHWKGKDSHSSADTNTADGLSLRTVPFSGTLELGGPFLALVIFILVAGRYAPADFGRFTVLVEPLGENSTVSGNLGVLLAGDSSGGAWPSPTVRIDGGKAEIDQIPAGFIGRNITVNLDAPEYALENSGPLPYPKDGILHLSARRIPPFCDFRGSVKTAKPPRLLDGVEISLEHGIAHGKSDSDGSIRIGVPIKCGLLVSYTATFQGKSEDGRVTLSQDSEIILTGKYR